MIDEITRHLNSKSDKVELKAEKIEMGLVEDIAKLTSQAKVLGKNLNDSVNTADKLKKELETEVSKVKKLYSEAEKFQTAEDKIWEKAKKATADLGLTYSSIKGWKEFESAGIQVNSGINGGNKYVG
jgi:SMC interacting uncharacterized protein involved in chromosome segregation